MEQGRKDEREGKPQSEGKSQALNGRGRGTVHANRIIMIRQNLRRKVCSPSNKPLCSWALKTPGLRQSSRTVELDDNASDKSTLSL